MSAYILSRFEGLRNLLPVGVSPGRHRRREDSVSGAGNRLARLPARLLNGSRVRFATVQVVECLSQLCNRVVFDRCLFRVIHF